MSEDSPGQPEPDSEPAAPSADQTTDAEPATDALPVSSVATAAPAQLEVSNRRRLFARLKAGIGKLRQPEDPAPALAPVPPPDVEATAPKLLTLSPFTIGFFGCLGVLLAVALFRAAAEASSILLTIMVSFFIALGLNPFVEFLTRRRFPRPLAVLVVSVAVTGVIAAAAAVAVPVFSEQINSLISHYPEFLRSLQNNESFARWDDEYHLVERATAFLTSGSLLNQAFGGILGAGRLLVSVVSSVVVAVVLIIYFLITLPQIKQVIYRLAPASRRPRARYLADESFKRIGGYLTGMFGVVTCAGTFAFLMLIAIGLGDYALALAVVVALFSFIPLVGATLSMVVVALVAFSQSTWQGIVAVAYFLIYQQVEAYIIQPRLMRSSVKVPPTVTIIAILIGGTLLGLVGAIIAIPLAATVLLMYREVLVPKLDNS